MVVAPAELEPVTGFLGRNCFPPRPPRAVGFGQREMVDIDLLPVMGERGGYFASFAAAVGFGDFPVAAVGLVAG